MEALFWLLIGLIFFTYIGYPVSLWLSIKSGLGKKKREMNEEELPTMVFVVAAYNEEACIRAKIENTLQLHYDRERLRLVVVTDGSNDQTAAIVQEYPQVTWLHQAARRGKVAAINRIMPLIKAEVVVLSDANTTLNVEALEEIGRAYYDPEVGAVSGEKVVGSSEIDDATASEGMYWRYESAIKKLDSDLNTMVGCAGELMSFRRELYQPVEEDIYIEDFVMSMRIAAAGYRVQYCPEARACELPSATIGDEMTRKVRIAVGGLQAIWRLRHLLNPLKYGLLTYQYIGHRALRWTLAPLSLLLLLVINPSLYASAPIYEILMWAQVGFYSIALLGSLLKQKKMKVKGLFIPYYFVMMNFAVFLGFFRLIKGQQKVTWEKAERRVVMDHS